MILLAKHIGHILLRMPILVQFPEVIFLFKVRYKLWFTIGKHCVYRETSDSRNSNSFASTEAGIIQLCNPRRYMVVKEYCLRQKPRHSYFHILM